MSVTDDECDDESLAPRMPEQFECLTEEDITWAVERAVSSIEARAIERIIRAAPDLDGAAKAARDQCRWWGTYRTGGSVEGDSKGLKVERAGRAGYVSFKELARRVRGPEPGGQITLF